MFSWFDTLKILSLSIIGFIALLICLRIFIICNPFTKIKEKFEQTRRLRRYGINMEEAHELTSMITNSNTQGTDEIIEQPFTRMLHHLLLKDLYNPVQLNQAHLDNACTQQWKKIGKQKQLVSARENTQHALTL
ncbi:hypothetical protein GHT06_009964 [Daphnia sinensis]|uniref:Uncharacterized protein n=1 Tax=Daphnia sinensis TaxID=1820382 RepID=A0AAD5LI83_9CRUS|nr:hypothetical protein GHT06_005387 [Daphnia sinensis]KAI9562520.1 hypothetical protein GHT06_009964 [Daphnia sinensis]